MKNLFLIIFLTAVGYLAITPPEAPKAPLTAPKVVTEQVTVSEPKPAETSQKQANPAIIVAASAPAIPTGNCALAYNYDWPQSIAYAVCMAESGGNPNSLNGRDNHGSCTGSYGLFQIGCFWFSFYGYEISFDPGVNAQIAYNIYKRQGGFGAWSAYTTGAYLRYM